MRTSVTLRLGHDSGLVTSETLHVTGNAVVRDTDDHLVGADGGPLPASETSYGDVRLVRDQRDGVDVLAAALERSGAELGTASGGGGLQGNDPVNPLGDVADDTTSGTKSASFRGQTASPMVLKGIMILFSIISRAASTLSCMPIPPCISPDATFSGVSIIPRTLAPTWQDSSSA